MNTDCEAWVSGWECEWKGCFFLSLETCGICAKFGSFGVLKKTHCSDIHSIRTRKFDNLPINGFLSGRIHRKTQHLYCYLWNLDFPHKVSLKPSHPIVLNSHHGAIPWGATCLRPTRRLRSFLWRTPAVFKSFLRDQFQRMILWYHRNSPKCFSRFMRSKILVLYLWISMICIMSIYLTMIFYTYICIFGMPCMSMSVIFPCISTLDIPCLLSTPRRWPTCHSSTCDTAQFCGWMVQKNQLHHNYQ